MAADRDSNRTQILHLLVLSRRHTAPLANTDTIAAKGERPARGNTRIEQSQAACGGITRIGKNLFTAFALCGVERLESAPFHVYLAAYLDPIGDIIADQA